MIAIVNMVFAPTHNAGAMRLPNASTNCYHEVEALCITRARLNRSGCPGDGTAAT